MHLIAASVIFLIILLNCTMTADAVVSSRCKPKHFPLLLPRNDRFIAAYQTLLKWLQPSSPAISLGLIVTHLTATLSATMKRAAGSITALQQALCARARKLLAKLSCP
jgi:hypothetical protein